MTYLRTKILIYLAQEAQIALLLIKKVIILGKYLDYTHVFSKKLVTELSKRFDINKHLIDLELSK